MKIASSPQAAPVLVDQVAPSEPKLSHDIQVIALMNRRLSTAIDLQLQMKQAHWNVKGPAFISLHELFDRVSVSVAASVDQIAERIVQIGGTAEGTIRVAAQWSGLKEYPITIRDGASHVDAVCKALTVFADELRTMVDEALDLDDPDTADLFTGVSRDTSKWLWMVSAHAETPN
ncbi:MAG: DNA starvation/stationary phase protection protein Dps [Planctomycetota bacterium]|jgi:starvation-inducible DNA-binding protein|nr:DNA starvation/stationary phase protection protein Dps [Planctomycetota bacterium]